jgi:short-chain Z-isoprenyl diphosphate synthase
VQLPNLAYRYYERRLAKSLPADKLPRHIGVMVDGNRRWAKLAGTPTMAGHQAGADKILEFLDWCEDLNIQMVTLYMLSTDNLNREASELRDLLEVIGSTLDRLGETNRVKVQQVGAKDLLPEDLAQKLAALETITANRDGVHVNVAIGYGGRREILDAFKALLCDAAKDGRTLEELASSLSTDDIESALYTKGQPDPDLVIRTSGEQRLSGFLTWQSAYSEFYFCEALWPDFRRVDFLRALRDFADRQRRFGT